MDIWDRIEQASEKGGVWIKLKDHGDHATVVFIEPVVEGERTFEKSMFGNSNKLKTVFAINAYDVESGEMKIWEAGPRFFKAMRSFKNEIGGDLGGTIVKVSRVGKKGDQQTSYTFFPKGPVTADLKAKIEATPLNDLKKSFEPRQKGVADHIQNGDAGKDIPF